ncbi:MAG: DsbA family protein [Balneolaceae bacterium]|nr:MAG: DsbA family protein [Balneolaceae bacterium]
MLKRQPASIISLSNTLEKPTLIYTYDPLCGWCYGFHPVMEKLAKRFADDLTIDVIAGGLAIGENAQTITEGYAYIRGALGQVEQTTGVTFGENFKLLAEEGSYFYNSEPSCRAQTVVNKLAPQHALEFAGLLQNAIFLDGKNLNEWDTFSGLMSELSIDTDQAETLYESSETEKSNRENFEWCKKHGASVFPTLLLNIGDEVGVMSRGYRPFDTIESHLHHLINNIKKLSG